MRWQELFLRVGLFPSHWRLLGCCLLAVCWVAPVHAQDKPDAPASESKADQKEAAPTDQDDNRPEYGGVVVNQTLTGMGQFFYVSFFRAWSEKPDTDQFALAIKERPSPRGGTEVLVSSDDQPLFRSFLPRNYAAAGSMGLSAVEQVHGKLIQLRGQASLLTGGDLAKSGL